MATGPSPQVQADAQTVPLGTKIYELRETGRGGSRLRNEMV